MGREQMKQEDMDERAASAKKKYSRQPDTDDESEEEEAGFFEDIDQYHRDLSHLEDELKDDEDAALRMFMSATGSTAANQNLADIIAQKISQQQAQSGE